jgi:hypothetical protein
MRPSWRQLGSRQDDAQLPTPFPKLQQRWTPAGTEHDESLQLTKINPFPLGRLEQVENGASMIVVVVGVHGCPAW